MAHYIPIMLECKDLHVVLVGGGRIAARKALPLIEGGAVLTIISPELGFELLKEHDDGRINWIKKVYSTGDLSPFKASLVYACTPDDATNHEVAKEAKVRNIPVNVATRSSDGTFISPTVIRRGDLVLSVSASGASPGLTRNVAKELTDRYGEEYRIYLSFCRKVRERIKCQVNDPNRKAELLNKLTELDILEQIRSGQFQCWTEEQIDEWIVKG